MRQRLQKSRRRIVLRGQRRRQGEGSDVRLEGRSKSNPAESNPVTHRLPHLSLARQQVLAGRGPPPASATSRLTCPGHAVGAGTQSARWRPDGATNGAPETGLNTGFPAPCTPRLGATSLASALGAPEQYYPRGGLPRLTHPPLFGCCRSVLGKPRDRGEPGQLAGLAQIRKIAILLKPRAARRFPSTAFWCWQDSMGFAFLS